jgi:hypothetical protein
MKSDQPMEEGGLVIDREVEIALDIEADPLEE